MRRAWLRTSFAVLASLLLAAGWGCAGGGKGGDKGRETPRPEDGGDRRALIATLTRGIEVHRLLDRPFQGTLGATLAKYSAQPLGLTERQIELWREEGLRIVAVPTDAKELDKLIRRTAQEPRIERINMGIVPEWKALATAPRVEGSKFVRVGGEVGAFADGWFRLLMRAYPVTLSSEEPPRLRVELIVQFHQPRRDPLRPDPPREERMGVFIPTTGLSIDLDGRWAVLITAERPEVAWGEEGAKAPAETQADVPAKAKTQTDADAGASQNAEGDAGAKDAERQAPAPPPMGPEGPRVRTAGEEALISPEGETRFVLILVPRLE